MSTANSTSTKLIPRNMLFGNPVKTQPQISPDGTMLAYLAPVNDVLNVWVGPIEGDNYQPITTDQERGIRFYLWAKDSKHVLYIQDIEGNEDWHLYATHLPSKETRDLTPFDNVQVQIVEQDKHFPNELLIALNKENPRIHDVYHLDLTSSELTLVAKNPGTVVDWLADAHFQVRGATATTSDGGYEFLIREHAQDTWRTLITWSPDDAPNSSPIGFSQDGRSLYLKDARNVNAGRLVELDIATGSIRVIAEDPEYDIGRTMIHPDTYTIQAVSFNRDRTEWDVLDTSITMDIDIIRGIHPGDFAIISRDNADTTWIVAYTVDNGPIPFYAYHRKSQTADFLFDDRPDLNNYTLATMEPITFIARDGLTIHSYLTLPPGEQIRPLPMVVNVHGGPWARDSWGYHPEAQWLANRGYACLQVNFRGSTGYGKKFLTAGNREWGRNMHHDLVDAVTWAVKEGIADPQKVSIYGGSYGGYAALVGATFTPDLFCCVVDIVGPSNLITLIETIPPYWSAFLTLFHTRVGNPDIEEDFLRSRSPLFKVDQIKSPMLIAQGANDPRVKQTESEQIVAAMKSKGIDYEYILFSDEGHGFAKPENRLMFYAAAEKFLAKHLGGHYEA